MGAVYLPCGGLQDDFNGYGDDATFQVSGQTNGDWAETGGGGDLVRLLASGRIYTQGTSGGAMLYSKASLPVAGSSCAISVRLIANGGPVGFFGFLDDVISPSKSGTISCEANGVNLCAVTTFGVPSGTFTLPIKLGIVVDGGVAYGVYESPTGWARLPNAPGISSDSLIGPAAHAVFGHSTTTADTIWDDFSVDAIPTTAILN